MTTQVSKMQSWIKALLIVATLGGVLFTASAMAAGSASTDAQTISAISKNIQYSVGWVANMLITIAVIAGMGFVMASFFKFHQHKMNPQQVPLSQGISLVLIGSAMIVFPYLLKPVSLAVFGNKNSAISGTSITQILKP